MVKDKKNAFTLVELLVVGTIIALLATIFLISYRGGEKQFSLQRSTHMLAQDIRRVQELAMRAEDFEGSVSRGGFGIHLESATSSYILFADCDKDGLFDADRGAASCVAATDVVPFPEELKLERERRRLEEGVEIISVSPNPSIIVFIPPDPAVRIRDGLGNLVATTTIVLGVDGLVETKTIRVNNAGLIAIE